jgi:GAF domain-containing protein
MQSRAVRLILLCLFLAAISTATFLFWKGDSEAATAALQAHTFDASARAIERGLLDVRGSQLAYAAAGQPGDRWVTRVAQGVDAARADTMALRAEATAPDAQAALDATTVALNEFAKADKRAVEYVRTEQRLLASDVVFGDGLERSEAALAALEQARLAELQARDATIATVRSRQVFALTAGAAAAVLVVLLLLPGAASAPAGPSVQQAQPVESHTPAASTVNLQLDDDIVSRPQRVSTPELVLASTAPEAQPPAPVGATVPMASADARAPGAARATDFAGIASLCVDLARVVDTRALPSLLERTARLLDASGIILWIADPDGRELNPIFAQGYPQQLVNRLGTIPRDAENATAAAFRTSLLQTVMADDISAGAIAAPLVTPGGCVGVMAAEVRHDSERQGTTLAAATIVAAQLATLVGPPSASPQARTAGA